MLKEFGRVHVTDVDGAVLGLLPAGAYHEKSIEDARKLSFKDETFDLVVSLDVFEHIDRDDKAVSEAY